MTDPTPAQLHHLAARARDGVALPAKHDQLAAGISIMGAQLAELDGAAGVAVSAVRLMNEAGARADRAEAAIKRVRAWIAGEPVTARSEFGSGYREALRDITDALDQAQQPTTTETGPAVTIHACPGPDDNGISPCCKRPPFEFRSERLTRDPEAVTCPGPQQQPTA